MYPRSYMESIWIVDWSIITFNLIFSSSHLNQCYQNDPDHMICIKEESIYCSNFAVDYNI